MKTIEELQKQLDQAESSVTRFEVLKIMASRAVELQKENDELKAQHKDLKLRNSLLRERKDLPVERLTAYDEIRAQTIDEFKVYVKSGLKVFNEPSWECKQQVVIDEDTYFEMTLSEFDNFADKLRGKK